MNAIHRFNANCHARWAELQNREQKMILAGALALGVILLGLFVIAPWLSMQRQLDRDLPRLRANLAQMQVLANTARQAVSKTLPAADPAVVASEIRNSLAQSGLAPDDQKIQADAQGRLHLTLDNADFDTFLLWLDKAQKQHHLSVVSAKVNRTGSPGMAVIDLTLALPGNAAE
ncbi:MAG: type secretion system protein [Proteobacteria bacterium]|nr:type secretion system protein [Pseudomonadota bacterium]